MAEASEKAKNLKNLKKAETDSKLNVKKGENATSAAKSAVSNSTSGISSSLLERVSILID